MKKRGSLAVDFIFTFVATFMMTFFLIMLAFTLCMMEVSQYITYAAAREYFISHINTSEQREDSALKFAQLKGKFFPRGLSSWFKLELQESHQLINENETDRFRYLFVGVQSKFKSKVLGLNSSGFFGAGLPSFELEIASYLGREITQEECKSFFASPYHNRGIAEIFRGVPIELPSTCPSVGACYYEC